MSSRKTHTVNLMIAYNPSAYLSQIKATIPQYIIDFLNSVNKLHEVYCEVFDYCYAEISNFDFYTAFKVAAIRVALNELEVSFNTAVAGDVMVSPTAADFLYRVCNYAKVRDQLVNFVNSKLDNYHRWRSAHNIAYWERNNYGCPVEESTRIVITVVSTELVEVY